MRKGHPFSREAGFTGSNDQEKDYRLQMPGTIQSEEEDMEPINRDDHPRNAGMGTYDKSGFYIHRDKKGE